MSIYHRENPFLKNLSSRYERKEIRAYKDVVVQASDKPGDFLTDETGRPVVMKTPGVIISKEFDTQDYVKIYRDSIPLLLELSRPALDFLLYIISTIRPKKDYIEFNTDSAMDFLGYTSRQSIYKAVDKLEEAGVLAKRHNNTRGKQAYWINPEIIYNGARNSLYNKTKEAK